MGLRTILACLRPGNGAEVVVECRYCGRTTAPDTDDCPECGASEFCRYEIPD